LEISIFSSFSFPFIYTPLPLISFGRKKNFDIWWSWKYSYNIIANVCLLKGSHQGRESFIKKSRLSLFNIKDDKF